MYFDVTETKIEIESIPALLITPKRERKKVVLVYYHGWGSSVENSRFRASIWAAAGYPVLLPEEALHGERGSWDYDDDMEKLPHVLIKNIEEYERIARFLDERYPGYRRIVCGHSLGGFTSMGLLSREDVDGAMALNGMGDWSPMLYEPYLEEIARLNPIDRVEEHVDKAILMLNGEVDESVDATYQKNYYEKIRPLHRRAVPLSFEMMEMTSHVVTTTMMELTLGFLEDI
ncbi:MAG: dienelactone hydrolase family protein [Peptoniphilus sp.]|nr:dienelactone hydrolase family protein [Peptoniphilus sp.]MDY6045110.1 dienelactone hydrolase family protein [Peptoniphilus sp.]